MTEEPLLILTTGGTIDKHYYDALSRYQIVETMIPRLLAVARVRHPFIVQEVSRKDSLDLTEHDRAELADVIRDSRSSRIIDQARAGHLMAQSYAKNVDFRLFSHMIGHGFPGPISR